MTLPRGPRAPAPRAEHPSRAGSTLRAAALAALFLTAPAAARDVAPVPVAIMGEPETVTLWRRDACETWDVPDAPARAFRDRDGMVHLIASHHRARFLSGPDPRNLGRECRVRFEGGRRDEPGAFDDFAWLSAFHTVDGVTVHALVHDEFHGHRRPALCPGGGYMRCWRNSVTAAVSTDGGRTFRRPEGRHLVATPPYRFDGEVGRHTGYFSPTGIVERDGWHYAMFSAAALGAQAYGACVMRTRTLADPSSWRAWDGRDFTVAFADPYAGDVPRPGDHVCAPVGLGRLVTPLGSLVRHEPSGLFLMTMAGLRRETGEEGFFVAASPDLVTWSRPHLVAARPVRPRAGECRPVTYDYPSLIDPDSPDRNFATVGDAADLYFVESHADDCRSGPRRDLKRVRVRIGAG